MENDPADGLGGEELLRQAQRCLARAGLTRDPERKAALVERAAMLKELVKRAKTGERL